MKAAFKRCCLKSGRWCTAWRGYAGVVLADQEEHLGSALSSLPVRDLVTVPGGLAP